jgi:hypothetical protein
MDAATAFDAWTWFLVPTQGGAGTT